MQITKFGLGIRFAAMAELPEREFARMVYEEIFSVLTLTELEGLQVYGGNDPLFVEAGAHGSGDIFLAVLMGGKHKQMRRVFTAIDEDAAIGMYLTHTRPYIENNRLERVEGLSYYGTVQKNGRVAGGDGTLDGLTVPHARGRRSPVGKGVKLLLAPEDYQKGISSVDAIKLLTLAARKHFQGVKLVPMPVSRGGPGFARALITACDGALRRAEVSSPDGAGKVRAEYAVLRGKLAVIETAPSPEAASRALSGDASSRGTGELIRRALDEGLRRFIVGVHERAVYDCGFGLARALGVKFFDAACNELTGGAAQLPLVASADAEFLNPAIRAAKFVVADAGADTPLPEGAENFLAALSKALGRGVSPGDGFAGALAAITGGELSRSFDSVLDALEFEKLLKGVALVVSGTMSVDEGSLAKERALACILRRCKARRIPVALIAGKKDENEAVLSALGGAGVMCFGIPAEGADPLAPFSRAADSMFRFIRIGRDVEKIGAPRKPRQKSFVRLFWDSVRERAKKD
ncbi:MAG TPA: glycerate kinase [Clostridia bacterium]|nr:glycerate kinase [Clostridia bacterium]